MKLSFASLQKYIEVPISDVEESRRAQLLNIVLLGMAILAMLLLPVVVFIVLNSDANWQDFSPTFWSGAVFIPIVWLIYWINRRKHVLLASLLFILLIRYILL